MGRVRPPARIQARSALRARRDRRPDDRSRESVRARSSGFRTYYDSHEELIARDDIDLIDVCTPSATHFELTWAALEAGKHVLCEKPVAYDFRDTQRAAALARRKGLKTKARLHLPLQPGDAVHEATHRRGLRRHAVHLQRLRAELAVARPAEPAAPGRSTMPTSR